MFQLLISRVFAKKLPDSCFCEKLEIKADPAIRKFFHQSTNEGKHLENLQMLREVRLPTPLESASQWLNGVLLPGRHSPSAYASERHTRLAICSC